MANVNKQKELELSHTRLVSVLRYDSENGKPYWLVKTHPNAHKIKVGHEAGHVEKDGYIRVQIDKEYYSSHRLHWFYHYGTWPVGVLDHINGDRTDNRIENLRDITFKINNSNKAKHKRDNFHLPTGVSIKRNKLGEIIAYRASWRSVEGIRCEKSFSLYQHTTHEAAIQVAYAYRIARIRELNEQGASYTDRHGI